METFITVAQTFGFPVAAVCGLAFFAYKFIQRVMDTNDKREAESKAREDKLQEILITCVEKIAEISHNILEMRNDICDLKAAQEKKPE